MTSRLQFLALCSVFITCVLGGCHKAPPELSVHAEPTPTAAEMVVPQMTALPGDSILLSWQRPLPGGGYAFEMVVKHGVKWSEVRTIAAGPNLSMFSADLPAVATLPGKRLLAYWEVQDKRGDRYATTITMAISNDEGHSWVSIPTPYGDALAGQHSFLSWFATKNGIGMLWLDAIARSQMRQAGMGSVGLRYAALNADGKLDHQEFVDPITCECCPTSAASTGGGPVVVYRGRQEPPGTLPSQVHEYRPTVRDIYIVRQEGGAWQKPHLVHKDNWIINACPDNGPAVDASANHVAVAWWTISHGQPKVQLAFSSDSGDSFGSAFRIDSGNGEGQVTVALLPDGRSAIVGWLENGETWARYVTDSGAMSRPVVLGSSRHHSRLPHWLTNPDGSVTAAWTAMNDGSPHLEMARIDVHPAD